MRIYYKHFTGPDDETERYVCVSSFSQHVSIVPVGWMPADNDRALTFLIGSDGAQTSPQLLSCQVKIGGA